MSVEDLNQLIHLLGTFKPGFDLCDIFISPDFQEVLLKNKIHSKSDTQILFGTFINLANTNINADVSLKIWFGWNQVSPNDLEEFEKNKLDVPLNIVNEVKKKFNAENLARLSALEYEVAVYRYITDTFIVKNLSPNFIPILAFASCPVEKIKDNILRVAKPDQLDSLSSFFKLAEYFPSIKLNILVTGTTKNGIVHLADFIDNHKDLPKHEIKSIIFQIVYTLYLLEQVRVAHNDLHLDNILIQTLSEPTILTYKISPEKTVSFKTKYVIRFFDWDRAHVDAIGDNPLLDLDWNIELNTINRFEANRDFYQIVCLLKTSPQGYRDGINDILPNPRYDSWEYDGDQNVVLLKPEQKTFLQTKKFKLLGNGLKIIYLTPDELRKILKTDYEIDTYIGLERFKHSEEFIVKFDETDNYLFFLPGWGCQPLYKPSGSLLYNLSDIFTRDDLLDRLSHGLVL